MAAAVLTGTLLLAVPACHAAGAADSVSTLAGVVRDARGVAQMGALVQVVGANAVTVATAFTDAHGRYLIPNLAPGHYGLRASATLFLPATRGNLELRRGTTSVVDLTLAALFDTASWLPAQRRRGDEPEDDWKWTLRSSANRPILRIVEDGTAIEVSSSAESRRVTKARARETVASGDGGFGSGGVHDVMEVRQSTADGGETLLRADMGATRGLNGAAVQSASFDAGFGHRSPNGTAARTLVSYRSHPELASGTNPAQNGLGVLTVSAAQRTLLGESVELESGGSFTAVHAGGYAVATRPFLRITAHPAGGWSVQYRMSTDRGLQGFEDTAPGGDDLPVATVRNGRLQLETGRHQEASLTRREGRAAVAVAYYRDALDTVAVAGGEAATPNHPVLLEGAVLDPATGTFRTLAGGMGAQGARVTASTALLTDAGNDLWLAAEWSSGAALASSTGPDADFAASMAGLHRQSAQAATVALKGAVAATGTRVRASYRWQTASMVTAVDPYSSFADQAYLSCLVHQPIRWAHHLPPGLQATIDVTNLLAEGYRPFISADGQTLYFAQAPRSIQAGLSFSF